jgi:beta-phosphoglucomutase-like phosphatase (HAD superfamily)
MSRSQAVIFDMDGVIVDSEPRHEAAFLEVVREIGYGERLSLRFEDFVGRSDHELWQAFIKTHQPPHTLEELLELKRERVIEIIRREQPLFEGLTSLVKNIAPGYRLGVASGSERLVVEEVLALQGLRKFFQAAVTASDVQQGKPAPDIFLRTAELLEVTPKNCWVIEDSKPGIAAGLAAGMRVIAITNTYPAEELGRATYVMNTYAEIERLLMREGLKEVAGQNE